MDKIDTDGIFYTKQKTKGRPKKILTEKGLQVIEVLCEKMCPIEDICSILGVSDDTLRTAENEPLFREAQKRGYANCKRSLREKQIDVALNGNATLLVWLGKQYLGQTEKVEQTNSYEDLTPLAKLLDIKEDE